MRRLALAGVLTVALGCGGAANGPAPETRSEAAAPQSSESDVKAFVRQHYIHGLPYDEASRFDGSVVPTLLEMLRDPDEKPYWSNVVLMLGIVGDETVADTIIEFMMDADADVLSREEYAAKTSSALTALGYLVHRTGSERALEYLLEGLDPESWARKGLRWASPYQSELEERNRQLTELDVMALALTGHPRAGEALRALKREGAPQDMAGLVDEAIAIYEQVSQQGLRSYYQNRQN